MFKNIVVPLDLLDKPSVDIVLQKSVDLVRAFESTLSFIYVIPDFGMKAVEDYLPKHWIRDQKDKHNTQIIELIKRYIPSEIKVNINIARGSVYDQIIQYSNDIQADLIVVSAIRPQLRDYMLGPNASKIVRHSLISVLVIRE